MTDRDRLIELIEKAIKEWGVYFGYSLSKGETRSKTYEDFIAEHLLANGVIVPPCKVGDMVYIIGIFTGQFITNQVVAINYGESGLFLLLDSYTVVSVEEQLGKTVFLTKEEAEEKLKELK